jgi:predicted dinucleotide-binding enzyme
VRDVQKYTHLEREQPGYSVAPVRDAVAWAKAGVLAIPGVCSAEGVRAAAAALGPGVDGNALLDATNHLRSDLEILLLWEDRISGDECLAAVLSRAHVFKAFNSTGYENMRAAGSGAGGYTERLTMLMAGPAGAGRAAAEAVVTGAGFAPRRVSGVRWALNLEALAELYIQAAREWKGRLWTSQAPSAERAAVRTFEKDGPSENTSGATALRLAHRSCAAQEPRAQWASARRPTAAPPPWLVRRRLPSATTPPTWPRRSCRWRTSASREAWYFPRTRWSSSSTAARPRARPSSSSAPRPSARLRSARP